MLDEIQLNKWAIVRYYNKDGSIDTFIRKQYQWDAQKLQSKWEYLATGLSLEQAQEFIRLF